MYLCQEGGGEGGEKEHIYNLPKGGLVPPLRRRVYGEGVCMANVDRCWGGSVSNCCCLLCVSLCYIFVLGYI